MSTRRTFLVTGAAAATALTVSRPAAAAARPAAGLRAAVLEFRDPWTSATGLGDLLTRAGVTVVPLDVSAAATAQQVDLIAFGSFTNNDATYLDYVSANAESLREFAAAGGVVLDLAQSDQFGADTTYLPATLGATRADPDHDTIYPTDADHPLVKGMRVSQGQLFTGRNPEIRVSWETLESWRSMRVLMACDTTGFPPCLLEGAYGRGRFLVTSLTVDKCFDAAGAAVHPAAALEDSAAFFAAVAAYTDAVRAGTAPAVVATPMPPQPPAGPLVGHVDAGSARIWARPGLDPAVHGAWTAILRPPQGEPTTVRATVSFANDSTLVADARHLLPDTRYDFELTPDTEAPGFAPLTGSFTTAPPPGRPARVVMGMGSCAPSVPDAVWTRIVDEECDSFVMLGDTPYIDSGDLHVARTKQRQFLMLPELARLVRQMPVWATWDDHDFALNGNHGDFPDKRNTRTAFVDHRANATFGHNAAGEQLTTRVDGEGVYTSFRRGPLEVFLIDPRWFSTTEPSWADPAKPTCIGAVQWEWLQSRLSRSTATFKALVTGMIWDDKENSESDDWGFYAHERDAIFDFVAAERIPGVFLIGGDIHVSRALNYGPRVGYDLWQFIVSPLHDRTIPSLNVPSPYLVHSAVEPHVFLKLVVDTTVSPATLIATWITRDGRRLFEVRRTAAQMGYPGHR